MKQGQTTLSTHPATLPLVEVGNNDRGVVVRVGRVSVRLTAEPGGTGNVRVAIFGAREFVWPPDKQAGWIERLVSDVWPVGVIVTYQR